MQTKDIRIWAILIKLSIRRGFKVDELALLEERKLNVSAAVLDQAKSSRVREMFSETIEKFRLLEGINRLLFLFSGGKDATFGLKLLSEYIRESELDIKVEALMITYPKHVYYTYEDLRNDVFEQSLNFWSDQGVDLKIINPPVQDIQNNRAYGCGECKKVRMSMVETFIRESGIDRKGMAIVTGYTLFDAHAYIQEFGLVTNYSYQLDHDLLPEQKNKILNCLHKMRIQETLPSGVKILRPLLIFKEDTIKHYLKENDIPFINVPCNIADFKPKRNIFKTLNEMSSDLNITYDGLMAFLERNAVVFPEDFQDISNMYNFTDC
jgi:tRNA(Ile)-lysidine synthase TilS/MesJ